MKRLAMLFVALIVLGMWPTQTPAAQDTSTNRLVHLIKQHGVLKDGKYGVTIEMDDPLDTTFVVYDTTTRPEPTLSVMTTYIAGTVTMRQGGVVDEKSRSQVRVFVTLTDRGFDGTLDAINERYEHAVPWAPTPVTDPRVAQGEYEDIITRLIEYLNNL
ncbi:MAG: hypothetical protein AAB421_04020 [Patescibacteria group bacterium]